MLVNILKDIDWDGSLLIWDGPVWTPRTGPICACPEGNIVITSPKEIQIIILLVITLGSHLTTFDKGPHLVVKSIIKNISKNFIPLAFRLKAM